MSSNGSWRIRSRTRTHRPRLKEVTAEIERYIVKPGQACAYKVGMLKVKEFRMRAETELGEKFDQREFHETVLHNGALSLDILEEQVNGYIKKKKT